MWVFGYGSLMWDGWENKASVRNCGTKARPGPTLNIQARENGSCRGIAFEFPNDQEAAVMDLLKDREGGFDLPELPVTIPDAVTVGAITPVYTGKNIIIDKSLDDIVAMIAVASGTSGKCRDYAHNVIAQINALGVQDGAVAALSERMAETGA